ncbi:YjjG family noncanonical pyrimidine nucleotidase [Marinilabiliaceae bacterium ANBcel2]|nr:YjjG family noncanonical pyrimidine nucleotidase [Marinilabiliaceae bacterium ANBcel2]
MGSYKNIFFDLDHTLWDYKRNEQLTIKTLLAKYDLKDFSTNIDSFFAIYTPTNELLWEKLQKKEIKRSDLIINRFSITFNKMGIDDPLLINRFATDFVELNPYQKSLIPYTRELLNYLYPKYNLYIITNGFTSTQEIKLEKSEIKKYFKKVYTSEKAAASKPSKSFFQYAIKSSNAKKAESLIIGDSLHNDIAGAINFNLDYIYFNPSNKTCSIPIDPKRAITSLKELFKLL